MGEISNTVFDSIIIPLDTNLFDINNIEELIDTNLKVFVKTELHFEDNKVIKRKLDEEYCNKVI